MSPLLALALVATGFQPGRVVPSVSVQPDKIDLGQTTKLTLALEGPAPLRIDLPAEAEKLLAPQSAAIWLIRPLGPPKVETLDDGRERWEQSFRLSPFFHGERVMLAFAPLRVNGQEFQFDAQTVRVRRTLDDAKAENAIPVTGIEPLPALPPEPSSASGWPMLAVLGGVFALAVAVVLVRRSRAVSPPVPPVEWAERELNRLERDHALERIDARAAADRLAAILREFVERRFDLPATRLTTGELRAACESAEWPADRSEPVREMLTRCDSAKFAGDLPDPSEMLALLASARSWVLAAQPTPSS